MASSNTATLFTSTEMDLRGPYRRERRRALEKAGLYPQRIAISARKNVWVAAEVLEWERAKAAGATDESIRALVRRQIALRAEGMPR